MSVVLGVDAGGSKTAWRLGTASEVLREGRAAGIQATTLGTERAAAALAELLGGLSRGPDEVAAAVVGMAGAGAPEVRSAVLAGLRERGISFPVHLAGDHEVAAGAALADGPGVAVWSGTGSFAVARGPDGWLARRGGRGFLLGDEGGAFRLVVEAAAAAVRAADGVGPATAFGRALASRLGPPGRPLEVVQLGGTLQRTVLERGARSIAECLDLVVEALEGGDEVVDGVVRAQFAVLSAQARAALEAAGARLDAPVVLGGGAFLAPRADALRRRLADALSATGLDPAPRACVEPACQGALRLAASVAGLAGADPALARWLPDLVR